MHWEGGGWGLPTLTRSTFFWLTRVVCLGAGAACSRRAASASLLVLSKLASPPSSAPSSPPPSSSATATNHPLQHDVVQDRGGQDHGGTEIWGNGNMQQDGSEACFFLASPVSLAAEPKIRKGLSMLKAVASLSH